MNLPKEPHSPQASLAHPAYRPEIDGLRAVAVVSVVLFHAFPDLLPGGFVGVDVFFVISGFLISSIIMSSLEQGRFSFAEFYARRVRRIFPALSVVLCACLGFGWVSLLAGEYQLLGKHVAAGAGFVSNLVLWGESGYFDEAAEGKPLLHLWSLGIEEQYYIVWPLLLWIAWRARVSFLAVAALAGVVSLGINLAVFRSDPVADFYSPLTRFWELLAGSALARCASCAGRTAGTPCAGGSRLLREVSSALGAGSVAAALALVTRESLFPGVWALVPVAGTAMIIAAGPSTGISRLVLSRRPIVWVGLISFPLYLWHWPLLSFARIIESAWPPLPIRAVLAVLSVPLAWLTYRFVERPLRFGARGGLKAIGLAALIAAVGSAGLAVFWLDGVPGRTAAQPISRYEGNVGRDAYLEHLAHNFRRCENAELKRRSMRDAEFGYRCFQSKRPGPIEVMILGDSHAEHLLPGLARAFPDLNVGSFLQASVPVIDNPHFAKVFPLVLQDPHIKAVVLAAQWEDKIKPHRRDIPKRLSKTLMALASSGKIAFVLDDVPNYPFHPNRCKYQRAWSSSRSSCEMPRSERLARQERYSAILAEAVTSAPGIRFISLDPFLCNDTECSMVKGGEILYRDEHHLNVAGSIYVGERLREPLAGALNRD